MKKSLNDVTLFCTTESPNGTNQLILVDNNTNEIIDSLDNALFGATCEKLGANRGVYAETAGGYAGQIHGAAYIGYDNDVWHVSNLETYECECELCEEHGYEESPCEIKDWNMIEFMDNTYDGEKLYWVEPYALENLAANSPVQDGTERIFEFLSQYIVAEDLLEDNIAPNEMQRAYMLANALSS